MSTGTELKLLKHIEEVSYRIYPTLVNFPKCERYGLCQEIKKTMCGLYKYISIASTVKSKRKMYGQKADGELQTLKFLVKLSKKQEYISIGFFEEIDIILSDIGRMLSGFIQST